MTGETPEVRSDERRRKRKRRKRRNKRKRRNRKNKRKKRKRRKIEEHHGALWNIMELRIEN